MAAGFGPPFLLKDDSMQEQDKAKAEQAMALFKAGKPGQAVAALQALLARYPGWTDGWFNTGYILKSQGVGPGAHAAFSRALALGIDVPEEALLNRAAVSSELLGQEEAGLADLRQALQLRPGWLPALLNLGNLHEERGEREQAMAAYTQALEQAAPASLPADEERFRTLRSLASTRLALLEPARSLPETTLVRLQTDARDESLDLEARVTAGLGLGRILDEKGRHESAFRCLEAAKGLLRAKAKPYRPEALAQAVQGLMQAYDGSESQAEEADAGAGQAQPEPLFICGMFRSGSTLVEQMLAAHPAVQAAGELDLLMRMLALPPIAPFPERSRALSPAELAAAARSYREQLLQRRPQAAGARLVTDKRPDNFLLLGLIKSLFPRARIVHTRRHPMDTGLSIYSHHLNAARLPYSTSLQGIGHYTGQYRRLMAHWEQRFGPDIHAVDYEDLVRDPRAVLGRLLAFLGLPWDDTCLDFHRQAGSVRTASYWQVRQPLHQQSAGRWQTYRTQLQPLAEALRANGVVDWAN